ncbi:MAG: hypothetical protein PHH70_02750 [Candidatus Gracilibacteria bacterium]|nr:hypothetical protein [Candidatus Gracilibacteria bacterium]
MPTLTETPQTLIPTGSFAHLPDFATKVQEALDLVNPADMEVVVQKKQEIEEQKAHLTTLIEELKESQKDYDFSDYEERLLLSDTEIENILENDIFREDEELTELGENFYRYLDILTEGKSEELKGKMKRKLVRELGLEDRVYENNGNIGLGKNTSKKIKFKNKEQFIQDIQEAGLSGIQNLTFFGNDLYVKCNPGDVLEFIETAGLSGIRNIDLRSNGIKHIEAGDGIKLIETAGLSGIRTLDIDMNAFFKKCTLSEVVEFIKTAGLSGISSLDLSRNDIFGKLDGEGIVSLITTAGGSGVRRLNLQGNNILERLEFSEITRLIRIGGLGLRNIDLNWIVSTDIFIKIMQLAGLSGMRSINLRIDIAFLEAIEVIKYARISGIGHISLIQSSRFRYKTKGYFLYINEIVNQAGLSGIRSMSLNLSGDKLHIDTRQALMRIAKQYKMKLRIY